MSENLSLDPSEDVAHDFIQVEKFCYEYDRESGRVVLYTSTRLHGDDDPHSTGENEVMFYESDSDGILGRSFEATELMLDTADVVSSFALKAFDEHLGLRLAASHRYDYESKLTFRVDSVDRIEEICNALVKVIYYSKPVNVQLEPILYTGIMSEREQRALAVHARLQTTDG